MSYEEEKQDRKIERLEAEIERLRADNAGLSKAVIDIQEGRDLAQAKLRTYHKAWEEQAARIKELEDALAEERANAKRSGSGYILMTYLREKNIDPDKYFSEKAREELLAEGKIGPDEVLSEAAHWVKPEDGDPTALEEFPEGYYSPVRMVKK